ncbi:MAG: lysylphosphatidylglycerol synthase transmembrane domain-containing protein [Gemmatimonadota bacterium]|nr:lysylphosphatidylglycerol synthase transmembrane domain-containing protein [Gemmatimonadota bacterium]
MARLLTPKVLRRGFEFSLLASVVAFGAILFYGNDLDAFLASLGRIRWGWIALGLLLASMDWIGGGLRLWVTARVIHPDPPLGGMIMAGGMSAWGGYVTPLQSGNGPMLVYTMKRYGVPMPVAVTSALMTFIATIVFFAVVGPLAISLGAGQSLTTRGNLLGLSLYDLFLGSLSVFASLGLLLLIIIAFPRLVAKLIRWVSGLIGRRSARVAARLDTFQSGVDRAQAAVLAFNSWRGWLAVLWATLLTAVSHANKLLAGYVTLRALGIQASFVDVLLLQILIMFLLYFAPTPGGAGLAEVVSALVMGIYVPRELTPVYILIWRLIQTYFTVAAGSVVFWQWVRQGLKGVEQDHPVESTP